MSDTPEIAAARAALADIERAFGAPAPMIVGVPASYIRAVLDAHDAVVDERDAYKRAKAENDERYMIERDEARAERDALAAALATAHRHAGRGDGHATPMATADCIVSALVDASRDAHEARAERDALQALLEAADSRQRSTIRWLRSGDAAREWRASVGGTVVFDFVADAIQRGTIPGSTP